MFEAVTSGIHIKVHPVYMPDKSSPNDAHYVWAYHIVIQNKGQKTVQLLERHWVITDAQGQVQDVRGEGVIGEQPILKPGDSFAYTSGVNLRTSNGFMRGEYTMQGTDDQRFEALIPPFALESSAAARVLN